MAPIIGMTAYAESTSWSHWTLDAALLPLSYVESVRAAGGIPVLLPSGIASDAEAERLVALLDGLVLTGGRDIEPARYGAEPHPLAGPYQADRDRSETALLEQALAADLPLLGICRGMQLLNIACGGDLHQHVPEIVRHERHNERVGAFSEHEVEIVAGSLLAGAHGTSAMVKSHHHQAPNVVGAPLTVTARAADGTVEGVEHGDRRFAVGVLWHPEEGADLRLFERFVEACRGAQPARSDG